MKHLWIVGVAWFVSSATWSCPAAAQAPVQVAEFKHAALGMTPEQAADGWLELFDQKDVIAPDDVLKALPPPAAWYVLAQRIDARPLPAPNAEARDVARAHALRLIGASLTNNRARQRESLAVLHKLVSAPAGDDNDGRRIDLDPVRELAVWLAADAGDPAILLPWLEASGRDDTDDNSWYNSFALPDLVRLFGDANSERILRKALVMPQRISLNKGGQQTLGMARKLALELSAELKAPQWDLVDARQLELFEAMEKKFITDWVPPAADGANPGQLESLRSNRLSNHYYRQAKGYYLLGLITTGRDGDAMRVAREFAAPPASDGSFPYNAARSLNAKDRSAVAVFLHKLLSEEPGLDYWDDYLTFAAATGQTDQLVALARQSYGRARADLTNEQRGKLAVVLCQALLAGGHVEEGVKVLHDVLAVPNSEHRGQFAVRLASIGRLLERPESVKEGLGIAQEVLTAKGEEQLDSYARRELAKSVVREMTDGGDVTGAGALMAKLTAEGPQAEDGRSFDTSELSEQGVSMLGIYVKSKRFKDATDLLDTYPYWGVDDLAKMITTADAYDQPAGYLAALALVETGRTDQARRVLDATFDHEQSFDPAYELLARLHGNGSDLEGLLARLDALHKRDRYEERPLIWKAEMLRRAKRLDEAEKSIKAAIAIDPSDGEQKYGRRMRAYAVLADIHRDRGDAQQAGFFDKVVQAIRLSERADQFEHAGLLTHAIDLYNKSLELFADAYCIQSRLAIQLAEAGRHEEAAKHYRKAYELMPDSFGRVESHCFGCEGAFAGSTAQEVAQETFARLARELPNKPQVHYLLGYLREAQGLIADAAASYRKAVELDPDYLNAWYHLGTSTGKVSERDDATLALLRLDPLRRHTHPELSSVGDLKRLWAGADAAYRHARAGAVVAEPSEGRPLYALTASAEENKRREQERANGRAVYYYNGHSGMRALPAEPGEVVSQTSAIRTAVQMLQSAPHIRAVEQPDGL